jgi:hypothetical protein
MKTNAECRAPKSGRSEYLTPGLGGGPHPVCVYRSESVAFESSYAGPRRHYDNVPIHVVSVADGPFPVVTIS